MPNFTIVTPSVYDGLVGIETLREEIPETRPLSDRKLFGLIREASEIIYTYCNVTPDANLRRTFGVETLRVEYELGDVHGVRLMLPWKGPVTIVSVETTEGVLSPTYYTVDGTFLCPTNLYQGSAYAWCRAEVVMATGWDLLQEAQPRALLRGCIEIVRGRLASVGRDPAIKKEVVPGVLETEFWVGAVHPGFAPPDIMASLEFFRG